MRRSRTHLPAGQAAWILEKFWAWTDCNGHPENALGREELLDNVMLYWLPGTGASSARLYWESFRNLSLDPVTVRSKSLSVTFWGRSSRSGLPHFAHFGPAESRARSTRLAAEQKGQLTTTGRVAGGVLVVIKPRGSSQNSTQM